MIHLNIVLRELSRIQQLNSEPRVTRPRTLTTIATTVITIFRIPYSIHSLLLLQLGGYSAKEGSNQGFTMKLVQKTMFIVHSSKAIICLLRYFIQKIRFRHPMQGWSLLWICSSEQQNYFCYFPTHLRASAFPQL